jgi:hypothetical protein
MFQLKKVQFDIATGDRDSPLHICFFIPKLATKTKYRKQKSRYLNERSPENYLL